MHRKKHPLATAGPGSGPIIAAGRGPQAPSPLSHPKVRLLLPFHFLFACHLECPSIKEWVGMHEKLKHVITYSPSEPLASLRVMCFSLYLVTRVHCAWLSLISIPHKPCCSGSLSKLKYQTFVWNHFLSHYHTKDYESWKKEGDWWGAGEGGTGMFSQEGGRHFFLIQKCGDKIIELMKWKSPRSMQYLKIL